jgi:surface carbohydrate biosynthesis protein (TIGR04326 family)
MTSFLTLIESAVPLLRRRYNFTFKPHPGYVPSLSGHPGLKVSVTRDALAGILSRYDVALSANSTSAALDAHAAGLPVVVMLDGDSLNLSPLRGRSGVVFAGTAADLAAALDSIDPNVPTAAPAGDIFFLDPELPRWMRLVNASTSSPATHK